MPFTQPFKESASSSAAHDDADSKELQEFWRPKPGQINVGNRHAQRARMTPLHLKHQTLFSNEEYYTVDLERNYSKEWPSVEIKDKKLIFKRGFLEPLEDPDAPYYFLYSGVERFAYTLPERAVQTVATSLFLAAYAAAFTSLYAWQPELAAAALVCWLRNSLSLNRWAALLALAAIGKVWIFWAALAGKLIDGVLERHAPDLRDTMWFAFKVFVAFNVLSTSVTPALPIWPFAPGANGAFDYPFTIFKMQ